MATLTSHNTGLAIKRNGSKFTASWKIKAKDLETQKIRYRIHNGKKWLSWTTKSIGVKKTEYSFSLSASASISMVQVQTKVKRSGDYKASKWSASSAKFDITRPPAPSLSVTNNSSNSTTFSWSINASDTKGAWFYRCYYRTKCTTTPSASTGWSSWTYASSSSYTYTDSTNGTARAFQIKAKGPAGYSAVKTQRHYIGLPPVATWRGKSPVSCSKMSSYYKMVYAISLNGSTYSVDSIVPQYYIGSPDSDMSCPSGANFSDGSTYNYNNNKTAYSLAITTDTVIGDDECMWARIKTVHDSNSSYSTAYRVKTGVLAAPTATVTMGTVSSSGFSVTVAITDAGTNVSGAYAQVYLEKASAAGDLEYIGCVANGSSSATLSSSTDLTGEDGYSIYIRNVMADGASMASDWYIYTASMPSAPTIGEATATTVAGKVLLTWTNTWSDANGQVIAWTDDPDNWMSTEEPETFEIEGQTESWYVVGLETGKQWWFRVRSSLTDDENVTYSSWSSDATIDLASAPIAPVLYLSEEAITEEGMVTAYWSYVSGDGTGQAAADIVTATYADDEWAYGDSIGSTSSAQHIDIYAEEQGWTNGTTVYLALQTQAESGGASDYSTPVQLMIAAEPTVTVDSTDLVASDTVTEYFVGDGSTTAFVCSAALSASPTVTVGGSSATATYSDDTVTISTTPSDGAEVAITYTTTDYNVLTTMPLSMTVTTTSAKTLTVAIERAVTYPLLRPDGTTTDGAEGETVYVTTIDAEATNSISIELEDLIGRLDDGAWYNLIASVEDNFGQSAEADAILFKVHWSHQAEAPTATFTTDTTNYITRILPVAPSSYASGDTCDIYRLSTDQPELIISGGTFGTEYVDPYPAFGVHSGYKVVTVTACQDYITEDNTFAEYDTLEDGGYTQLDPDTMVIDFDGDRIELPYNITLDNSWSKDFKRTTYLGGHVAGDYNKAVTRDLSASSVLVRDLDEEEEVIMRELARYAGICHVRTPDGSSFAADVQVSEAQAYDTRTITYELKIKKVDSEGYDGMTYAEWSEMQ